MSFLANLFGGGQQSTVIAPPPATPSYSSTSVQAAGQRQLVRRTGGRASTVLSLNGGSTGQTQTASAALLGQ
jgi:hypothetical protein